MLRQDNTLQVQLTVSRDRRDQLSQIIQQNPDIFLELQILNTEPPYPNKSIFINYRRDDSEDVCGRIYDRLVKEFSKSSVFKDVDDIPAGVDFRQILEREVGSTDLMLVIIGQSWTNRTNKGRLNDTNDFVRFEIETALRRNIPVIPVLVQRRALLPNKNELPKSLQDLVYRNARLVRPDPDFHKDMDRLIQGIREVFNAATTIPPEMPQEGIPAS